MPPDTLAVPNKKIFFLLFLYYFKKTRIFQYFIRVPPIDQVTLEKQFFIKKVVPLIGQTTPVFYCDIYLFS